MRIVFYASDKPREQALAKVFQEGAVNCGHTCIIVHPKAVTLKCDLACLVGVKSKKFWFKLRALGIPVLMLDKGYRRGNISGCNRHWRVSLNSHNPSQEALARHYSDDRFNKLWPTYEPWREKGRHILIAGSSEKYHSFYELPEPNRYAQAIVNQLREYTRLPVIYRPKPSWKGARPIKGASYRNEAGTLFSDLKNCHAVITHGSNSCFEAALLGIPTIVLGAGVMRAASSIALSDIENPIMGHRQKIFNAIAYHQWTLNEFQSGEAFKTIGKWL